MNKTIVSIIIPVYNGAEYLKTAVESIISQTLKDWEMFLIDDGSTDESGKICDEFAAADGRINVIHQKNSGAAMARNAGIEKARGRFLYFMDADDWAEKNMLSDMVEMAMQYGVGGDRALQADEDKKWYFDQISDEECAQLVVCGFYIETYYSDKEYYSQVQSINSVTFRSAVEFRKNSYLLFDNNLLYTPWNKLYLTSYIKKNSLKFPKTHWDDFPFNISVIRDVSRVVVSDKAFYHFQRKRSDSESEKYNPNLMEKREEENRWLKELYDYWGVNDSCTNEFLARRYLERIIGCIENVACGDCLLSGKEKIKKIKDINENKTVREAFKLARPKSLYMKAMLLPVKYKLSRIAYMEGKIISYVKKRNIKLFAALKANR